ncbi:MAG TPA: hypothetical protein VHG72_18230 [Polyangia bacterium]|nr:hypothetical protein [Polyangia bacterium]
MPFVQIWLSQSLLVWHVVVPAWQLYVVVPAADTSATQLLLQQSLF